MQFRQTKAQKERAERQRIHEDRTLAARPARRLGLRRGMLLGKTTTSLTSYGSCTVAIYIRSGTDAQGKANWVNTGKTVTAWDWFLNMTDTVPVDAKVQIEWYRTCWVVTQAYCEADDTVTPPSGPSASMPSSGGSFGGNQAIKRARKRFY